MTNRTVRFDDDLYELIEISARGDQRSINGQILWLVRAGLELRDINRQGGRVSPPASSPLSIRRDVQGES